jgi:hypothetical protein
MVFGEACVPTGAAVPYTPAGVSVFAAARPDCVRGVVVAVVGGRPRLLFNVINDTMEMAVVLVPRRGQNRVILGFDIRSGASVADIQRDVVAQWDRVNDLLRRGGDNGEYADAMDADFVWAGDTNSRFGPGGYRGERYSAEHALPMDNDMEAWGCRWFSCDVKGGSTQRTKGMLIWQCLERIGGRIVNDFQPDGDGGRCAQHTDITPAGPALVDIVALTTRDGFDRSCVRGVYVGAAAVAARLAPAWQPLFARQYHEIVLVEFAESRQRQPGEKRPEPPPPEHHFKLVAERVDRSQWGQWKKAVDAECASSGVQRNIGQMAKLCMEKAAEHLKPTLPGLPSAPTTRGFQRDLRDAQQACKRLWAAARGSEDPDEYARARALRTQAQRRLNAACSRRERVRVRICYLMLERGRRRNPRAFWAQLREVLGAGRRRGSASKIRVELRAEDGSLTSNPDELVRLWTALFSRIGDKPAGCFEPQRVYYEIAASIIVENLDYSAEPAVQNGDIPMLEMAQCMLRVTLGKSHDPQHVYGDIWHKLAVRFFDDEGVLRMHEYGPAMAMLLDAVNAVWRGDVKSDDDERIQRIVPVLKSVKLDPTLEGSYRDVTVTSRVSALTDVIAKQRLMRVLEGHGKVPARMDSAQHGFRPGRSCDTALFTVGARGRAK